MLNLMKNICLDFLMGLQRIKGAIPTGFFSDLAHDIRHCHAGLQKCHPYGIYSWIEASYFYFAMPV